jgi:hypothetical protein
LPEPFGPATIRKAGRSALDGDTVGSTGHALVLAARLGDILSENIAEVAREGLAPGVEGPQRPKLAVTVANALLADGEGARRNLPGSLAIELLDDDLGHDDSLLCPQY